MVFRAATATIKRNPMLFRLWYELYRKNTGAPITWFSPATELYIDGYPRSGNTFAQFLIQNLWPELHVVHHFHAIAPIKIALDKGIPVFILIREPRQAIASNYLKQFAMQGYSSFAEVPFNRSLLVSLAQIYRDYYAFASEYVDRINLIQFEELVGEPVRVMNSINKLVSVSQKRSESELTDIVHRIKDENFGSKDALGSSRPSKEKNAAKAELVEALQMLPVYHKCVQIFEQLNRKPPQ